MRRTTAAGLVAVLAAAAVGAEAQPSPAPSPEARQDRIEECKALTEAHIKAADKSIDIADEILVNRKLLDNDKDPEFRPERVFGDPTATLQTYLQGTDTAIRSSRAKAGDMSLTVDQRRDHRVRAKLLEKWYSVLLSIQSTRMTGLAVDPKDNAYTKWLARAKRRQPKLPAMLAEARQAEDAALQASRACWDSLVARPRQAPADAGSERAYVTTVGDMKLKFGASEVTGTYEYETGGRFANGPIDPSTLKLPPGVRVSGGVILATGVIEGKLTDSRLEGYWYQKGGPDACPTPRDGYPNWGRFEFNFSGDQWRGHRGLCDKPMDKDWDGRPK